MIKKTKKERILKLKQLQDELTLLQLLPYTDSNRIAVIKMQNRIRVERFFLNKIIGH